jgi:hypothetical protein
MNEQAPIPPVANPVKRLLALVRGIFSVVGLLLMGAGVCSGVFCFKTFEETAQLEREYKSVLEQVSLLQKATPGSTRTYNGSTYDLAGWEAVARQDQVNALWKRCAANELLACSIGLFLGGTSLALLGWGLRPRGVLPA